VPVYAMALVSTLGFAAGASVAASLRSATLAARAPHEGECPESGAILVLALTASAWGAALLLWCGMSIRGLQEERLLGGLIGGSLVVGACIVRAMRWHIVEPPRGALSKQSVLAVACAMGWGIFLPADNAIEGQMRRLMLVTACYVIACVSVWFVLLAPERKGSMHATHLAELLASATLILMPTVTLPAICALAPSHVSYHFAQAALFGTVALALLHLWPAVRRRVTGRRRSLTRSMISVSVGTVGLLVGGMALAGVVFRLSLPLVLLLIPIGLGYLPYLLVCIADAIVAQKDGRDNVAGQEML